jgi:hypothetical protein
MKQHDARKIDKQLNCQPGYELDQPPKDSREAWEKEQYACYYNYLFPLFKEARLPIDKIAKRTGLKERRIEEVLTHRLKPGGKSGQLFGHRDNNCYVCNARMSSLTSREPICIRCLQMIEKASLEIEEDEALLKQSTAVATQTETEIDTPPLPEVDTLPQAPIAEEAKPIELALPVLPEETLSVEQLRTMQQELNAYKQHFGPLPQSVAPINEAPQAVTEVPTPAEEASTEPLNESSPAPLISEATPNETEQLLQILYVDDKDLAKETTELSDLIAQILPHNNAPLRHFGFQRPKSYKT